MSEAAIVVVYFSQTGSTAQVAQAIAAGVDRDGHQRAELLSIEDADIQHGRFVNPKTLDRLINADAIVFGSPTYMGGVAAQFKAFADATSPLWRDGLLQNKLAAGFTVGSSLHGDTDAALHYLFILAQQHGMLWVGMDAARRDLNRLGTSMGCIAQSIDNKIVPEDLIAAQSLGERIANRVTRILTRY